MSHPGIGQKEYRWVTFAGGDTRRQKLDVTTRRVSKLPLVDRASRTACMTWPTTHVRRTISRWNTRLCWNFYSKKSEPTMPQRHRRSIGRWILNQTRHCGTDGGCRGWTHPGRLWTPSHWLSSRSSQVLPHREIFGDEKLFIDVRASFQAWCSLSGTNIPSIRHTKFRIIKFYIFTFFSGTVMVELTFGRCQNWKTLTFFSSRIFIPEIGCLDSAVQNQKNFEKNLFSYFKKT